MAKNLFDMIESECGKDVNIYVYENMLVDLERKFSIPSHINDAILVMKRKKILFCFNITHCPLCNDKVYDSIWATVCDVSIICPTCELSLNRELTGYTSENFEVLEHALLDRWCQRKGC